MCPLAVRKLTVAVFNYGSVNIDYVYRVPHLVRPGETLAAAEYRRHSGGKGANQSIALARAGAEVYHIGQVGVDGVIEREALQEEGVDARFVHVADANTGHAVIQVTPEGENAIVLFGGANRSVPASLVGKALDIGSAGDLFLAQNETNGVDDALAVAADRGLRVAFNPAPATEAVRRYPLDRVDVLVLNQSEAEILTGARPARPEDALDRLGALVPGGEIVLTLGGEGGWYASGEERFAYPAAPVERVVDTTAAGDCFIGYYLAGLAEGLAPRDRLALAARASALAVGRPGAAPSIPRRRDVG